MKFKIGDGSSWSADVLAVHPHDEAHYRLRAGKQRENLGLLICDLGTVNVNKSHVIRAGLKAHLSKPLAFQRFGPRPAAAVASFVRNCFTVGCSNSCVIETSLGRDQRGDSVHQFRQFIPLSFSELNTQSFLRFSPVRNSPIEFRFPDRCQTQPALPPICPINFGDPPLPVHNPKCPSQGSAVHCENFSEPTLGNVSSIRKCLQDRELRDRQPQRSQRLVITLGNGPGGAANIRAHARKTWHRRVLHA
jgi:hypothetical protein